MNTKHCETCGKLLISVKGDRRFCNALTKGTKPSKSTYGG